MPLKFCANITTMFPNEHPKTYRYSLAQSLGFRAVESWDMFDVPLTELVAAKNNAGMEHVLLNSPIGDGSKGEFGLASLPSRKDDFLLSLELGFRYAKALGCRLFHVTAGNPINIDPEIAEKTYLRNLEVAVRKAEQDNLQIVIEPISKVMRPHYFINDIDQAVEIVKMFNSPNLSLQLDIFHLQLMKGNLSNKIKEVFPYIGHVQFAQVPDRHEPDTPGEINYRYIFNLLDRLGFGGWIGCEYFPKGNVADGLQWIHDYGYAL